MVRLTIFGSKEAWKANQIKEALLGLILTIGRGAETAGRVQEGGGE